MSFTTYIDDLGKFSVLKEKMSFMDQLKHIGNYFYINNYPVKFLLVPKEEHIEFTLMYEQYKICTIVIDDRQTDELDTINKSINFVNEVCMKHTLYHDFFVWLEKYLDETKDLNFILEERKNKYKLLCCFKDKHSDKEYQITIGYKGTHDCHITYYSPNFKMYTAVCAINELAPSVYEMVYYGQRWIDRLIMKFI